MAKITSKLFCATCRFGVLFINWWCKEWLAQMIFFPAEYETIQQPHSGEGGGEGEVN